MLRLYNLPEDAVVKVHYEDAKNFWRGKGQLDVFFSPRKDWYLSTPFDWVMFCGFGGVALGPISDKDFDHTQFDTWYRYSVFG